MVYDVIVVGGGAAGMTAALYALRNGKTVMILEKEGFGGQITHSPKVENFPGTLSMSGNEFADKLFDQILAQGAEFEIDDVVSVEDGEVKTVRTADGNVYEGLTVVLATGVKHRVLGVEGEEELIGEGISFCAVCDGDFYADKTVCVIGGGNSALQEAILLAEKCKKVIMLQDLPMFTGEERLQQTLFRRENVEAYTDQKITGFQTANGRLTGVRTMDKKTGSETVYFCDGVFEAIGLIPKNDAFKELVDLNDWGYFDTDERCMTKTPGIYVAGDCRQKTVRQLTTAVADGSSAALAACRYINERK
ncbi:MAG: NAD(P)/FAD-dependent oxidoreductase [Erysipelotrichaceae bacterium]|jgi:thioredoxin reductase (NADPH)|nr:NAD(P)/FAD-dependent oxidoreductase [Erysipelotrichaceae bacterium]